ncbi:unnamed protein product [Closterium sp. Naga37s-1]|nr:unnamed protein product [Closterium sp. Naga37s-1]
MASPRGAGSGSNLEDAARQLHPGLSPPPHPSFPFPVSFPPPLLPLPRPPSPPLFFPSPFPSFRLPLPSPPHTPLLFPSSSHPA